MTLQRQATNRFLDPTSGLWTTKLLPGEYFICPVGERVATTLGSCIAACIRDRAKGIGGMNHFMLPQSEQGQWAGVNAATRYGNFAMEYLINEILKRGGQKANLEAKIFGGGLMMESTYNVGRENTKFAQEYLQTEGIHLAAADVGGPFSRKVWFRPDTGEVAQKKLRALANDTISRREADYRAELSSLPADSDVELF